MNFNLSTLFNFLNVVVLSKLILAVIIAVYSSTITPNSLSTIVIDIFDNPFIRIAFLCLIAYVSYKDITIGVLLAIAYLITISMVTNKKLGIELQETLKIFRSYKKENLNDENNVQELDQNVNSSNNNLSNEKIVVNEEEYLADQVLETTLTNEQPSPTCINAALKMNDNVNEVQSVNEDDNYSTFSN